MSQAERIHWINARLLNGQPVRWQDVKETFSVQRRIVFEDVKYLRERLGAPIEYSRRRKGWYYTEPYYQLPFLALSDSEAEALRRMLQAASTYLPGADAAAVSTLTQRLSPYVRGLPIYGGGPAAHAAEVFFSGRPILAPHLTVTDDMLADIRRAVDHRHRLRITYYSTHSDEITERTIQPYLLLNWSGELYVIAYCERRQAMRDFAVHRIQQRTVLEPARAYSVPDSFDAAVYLESSMALRRGESPSTVRVRFSPKQARWVKERIYHQSQKLTNQDDGGVILDLHVSGMEDVKRWVLSFGADAEVLEPEHLREEVHREIEHLQACYVGAQPLSSD